MEAVQPVLVAAVLDHTAATQAGESSQTAVLALAAAGPAVEFPVVPGVVYTARVLGTGPSAAVLFRLGADPAFTSTASAGWAIQVGEAGRFQVFEAATLHVQVSSGTADVYLTATPNTDS